jgi:ABC-type lipoprotein export system ATPase subunit
MIIDGSLDGVDENKIGSIIEQLTGAKSPFTLLVLTHDRSVWRQFSRRFEIRAGSIYEVAGG